MFENPASLSVIAAVMPEIPPPTIAIRGWADGGGSERALRVENRAARYGQAGPGEGCPLQHVAAAQALVAREHLFASAEDLGNVDAEGPGPALRLCQDGDAREQVRPRHGRERNVRRSKLQLT